MLRRSLAGALALVALAFSHPIPAHAEPFGESLRTERMVFSVPGPAGPLHVVGYLTYRGTYVQRPLQVLVHGAGFNHRYWDVPDIDGQEYSYARYMAERNYAVLAVDLPGTGESDKPDGDSFGLAASALVVDRVVGAMRSGDNATGFAFDQIALVGYSNGSVTAIAAQGLYASADVLVTTGWVHGCRPLPLDPADPAVQAALAEPYITLPTAARIVLLYYLPAMSPEVVAFAEQQLADRVPRRQFLDLIGVHADIAARCADGSSTTLTQAQRVDVPVLVQAGDHDDFIAPGAIVDQPPTEASFYPASPSVTVQVEGPIGHAFNVHLTHETGWRHIDEWLVANLP